MPKTFKKSEMGKKRRRTKVESEKIPSPSVSEESSEENMGLDWEEEGEEEIPVYKEPTMYENLVKTLRPCSEAYRKRQKEERENSIEEDMGSELEFSDASDAEDNNGTRDDMDQTKDIKTDDEEDAPETDEEDDLADNNQSDAKPSVSTSSFSNHLGYIVSKEEVDNLSKRDWKYKWEVPISVLPNCKWTGTGEPCIKDSDQESDCSPKLRLSKHWADIYEASGCNFHTSKQRYFFSLFNKYQDILHHNKKPFYRKGAEEEMDAYIMHSLNHLFRTRDLVTKNDAKVSKNQDNANEDLLKGDGFLDQGFTRPKILIILPYRSIAFRVVKRLIQLTPPVHKVNVEHFDRFSNEFGNDVTDSDSKKPSDYQALFGGNNDDHFMIGIKFTRRSIKLYGDFYSSDMIVASPIGLVPKIAEAREDKDKDIDYLSSIEVLIVDHADVLTMQNWDHVNTVLEQLNCMPSKQHGTNIMRIRPWYLDGFAKFYRQNIILGSYLTPDISASFNHHCLNYQGKVILLHEYKGVLPKVLLQVQQTYERFDAESPTDVDDARFEYFTKKVFPKIKDSIQGGVMLFTNSYFELLRLRRFLKSQNASFCLLDEYQKNQDISRARNWFFEGKRKIMVYTERSHFYHRYKIRGVQTLIIYSLPDRKEFYPEIVNMLEGSHSLSCSILFTKFDKLRLDRIVGTRDAKKMIKSEKKTFIFC